MHRANRYMATDKDNRVYRPRGQKWFKVLRLSSYTQELPNL